MSSQLGTVVVTAGRIGSAVRRQLRDKARQLILVDRAPLHPEAPVERVRQLELADLDAVAFQGGAYTSAEYSLRHAMLPPPPS